MRRDMLIGLGLIFSLTPSGLAQDFAIENARVWTGTDQGTLEQATVLVQDGVIAALGTDPDLPVGIDRLDAAGAWLTPGIISSASSTGLVEVGAEDTTDDRSAAEGLFSAAIVAADGFNPAAASVGVTRIEGITRIAVVPGLSSSLIAGQGFVADTRGTAQTEVDRKAFTVIGLGESGAAASGGSRAASWVELRAAFEDALSFSEEDGEDGTGHVLNAVDARAFGPAARGEQLILVAVSRASDIRAVLRLKAEMPQLNIALLGAEEGWLVADELRAAEVAVIIDPFTNLPSRFESLAATRHNAQRLILAGVTTAFTHFDDSSHQARLVLQVAGNSVASGVSHDNALAAITSVPADIFGLEGLGRIAVGQRGDLVLWDGDPLEVMSAPKAIWIDGEAQPLESRQTRLRDRYLDLGQASRPLAYSR